MSYKLLSVNADAKTKKGVKFGYLTGILYLAPAQEAGGKTLCPFSTAGCRAVCLFTAGRGAMKNVRDARIRKTKFWLERPEEFKVQLGEDIRQLVKDAAAQGMKPVVRLNGTTDILWENEGIMEQFPDVQFMDYTKFPPRLRLKLPPNYHLTYSFSEKKDAATQAIGWMMRGANVAVVFNKTLPGTFAIGGSDPAFPVINGDESDLRFTDPKGVIVGLKTKGYARKAETGPGHFVQEGREKVAA